MEYLYLRADEIRPGDILPDVSRSAVTVTVVDPRNSVLIRFARTEFMRYAYYGGDEYGFECFRVERPACQHFNESPTGERDSDGSPIVQCDSCGERSNVPLESEADYVRACDAQHAANARFRLEGEL